MGTYEMGQCIRALVANMDKLVKVLSVQIKDKVNDIIRLCFLYKMSIDPLYLSICRYQSTENKVFLLVSLLHFRMDSPYFL